MSVIEKKATKNPRKIYQNSFRLNAKLPFDVNTVKTHLVNVLELNFKEFEYADEAMDDMCITLLEEIREAIKSEEYDRYRYIMTVTIGEKKMQGVHIHHSFLWDHNKDKYVEHIYETNNFYVLAVVYAVYLD